MDEQLIQDAAQHAEPVVADVRPADPKPPIDPLRRVFVPIERRTPNGTLVFKTHDNQLYARMHDGSIRRATPKLNGKDARKARRKA